MPSTAIMQVTVRRAHKTTRNNNSSMLENEKNSMVSNARLCTKTLAVVYFKKGDIPIVLKEGMILTGTVRNVIDFGAFIDIGVKHDGLVHISEMSDKFIKNPSEIVSVGDIVKVKVIKIDIERQKVGLSMKV